jgi:hypothetical protein
MASQPPPEEPAPTWLADPSGYQAPPAPTGYQEWTPASEQQPKAPESFVPIRPTYAEQHAQPTVQNDGGFQVSLGGYVVTGWHAVVLGALILGAWTGLTGYSYVSTNAAFQAFSNAPLCSGPITNSCRIDRRSYVKPYRVDSSTCEIDVQGPNNTTWTGLFTSDACQRMGVNYGARVQVWQGQVVFIERSDLGHEYQWFWSTDSVVGRHGTASGDILIPLYLGAFYIVALVLALIYRFVNPFRRR